MASLVAICNLGLTNIGADPITDLLDETAEARACRRYYELTRDLCLERFPWSFARKTVSLAEVTNDKPGTWDRAFRKPTDCLKLLSVREQYVAESEAQTLPATTPYGFPYELEGSTIYCDLPVAFGRYIFQQTDTTRFSALFVDYLGWELAVRLAMPLTKDPNIRKEARAAALIARSEAEAADANQERHTSNHETEFVTER